MSDRHLLAAASAACLALTLSACSTGEQSTISASTSVSESSAATSEAPSIAPTFGEVSIEDAHARMREEGAELVSSDETLARLVTAWERAVGEPCEPSSSDLDSQKAAVFCGDEDNVVAVFSSPQQQAQFRKTFIAFSTNGRGPDTVVEGDGFSYFVDETHALELASRTGGEITTLNSSQARPTNETSPSRPAQKRSTSTAPQNCSSIEKVDGTVAHWNEAMAGRGTQAGETLLAAVRVGIEQQTSRDQKRNADGCLNQERLLLNFRVTDLELAELTPNGITTQDLAAIAEAGNTWLASIGRTDLHFESP